MINEVYWNLELNIKEGRYDDLVALAAEMSEHTHANEPGTLNYKWAVNADKNECHIYERYVDSDALMTHMANFGANFAGRFMDILEIKRFNVYGPASEEARNALGPLGAAIHDSIGGFSR